MIIGVPAELKTAECRVAITPDGVRELKALGHQILVEAGAGTGSSLSDADFAAGQCASTSVPPTSEWASLKVAAS